MIPLIIWTMICFAWLLIETDYMRVQLIVGREGYMQLPSGTWITKEDFNYLKNVIKPAKKPIIDTSCWYCSNGHDMHLIDLGLMSYVLCDCGASTVEHSKRRVRKLSANAKLAREIGVRFAPYNQANVSTMKRLIK